MRGGKKRWHGKMRLRWGEKKNGFQTECVIVWDFAIDGVVYSKKIHATFLSSIVDKKKKQKIEERKKDEIRLPNNIKNFSFATLFLPFQANA